MTTFSAGFSLIEAVVCMYRIFYCLPTSEPRKAIKHPNFIGCPLCILPCIMLELESREEEKRCIPFLTRTAIKFYFLNGLSTTTELSDKPLHFLFPFSAIISCFL